MLVRMSRQEVTRTSGMGATLPKSGSSSQNQKVHSLTIWPKNYSPGCLSQMTLFSSRSWYTNIPHNFTHNIQVSFGGWLVKLNCGPPPPPPTSSAAGWTQLSSKKEQVINMSSCWEEPQGNSNWKKPTSEDYVPHDFIYVTFVRWHDHRFGLGRGGCDYQRAAGEALW